MELVIVLFFFSLICTVVLEMFVTSDSRSSRAEEVNHAVRLAGNCMEALKGNSQEALDGSLVLDGYRVEENEGGCVVSMALDKEWKPTQDEAPQYLAEIKLNGAEQPGGTLVSGQMYVYRLSYEDTVEKREILTQMEYADYIPEP